MMITTNEIADKIAAEHSLTKFQGKAIVEAVFTAITNAANSGAETSIPGFGRFKVKDTPEREARNPATGAAIKVAAARKLSVQPAKALKDTLNKEFGPREAGCLDILDEDHETAPPFGGAVGRQSRVERDQMSW